MICVVVICFGKETVEVCCRGQEVTLHYQCQNGVRLEVPIQLNIGSKEKSELPERIG